MPAPANAPAKHPALGYLACATAGCLWSTGFYFGKVALGAMSVGHMVLYRFLFGTLTFLPLLRSPGFTAREWRWLLLASLLGVPVQFLMQFHGLALTTVSHAALMVGSMPVMLALGATIFAHERLSRLGWAALSVSTMGVALIVISGAGHRGAAGGGPSLMGDLLVVASMVVALVYLLVNKRLLRTHSALRVTAWGMVTGTMMLAAWVLSVDGLPPLRHLSAQVWGALVWSGVLCTATTTLLWNWGMRQVPASRAGVFLNIEPALGSALGVWLLGERLGPLTWVGGGM
ncbi:MAG TPA: DMT family transporter, partial [Acidobacteriaceae bacterium]